MEYARNPDDNDVDNVNNRKAGSHNMKITQTTIASEESEPKHCNYFHPAINDWFNASFDFVTPAQSGAWPSIVARQNTLLAAPTGSGKTLAAFLAGLDQLVNEGLKHGLPDETRILYISPLKALSNDIQKNLEQPLAGINAALKEKEHAPVSITTWVRTGDTPQSERQKAVKCPPHIVVTTPETAYLLLGSASGRNLLKTVRTVIVDEIHALASNKRGAHLSVTLARLDALVPHKITRIGLSATQKPLSRVAEYLVGPNQPCHIVDGGHTRERELKLLVPPSPLDAIMSNEAWEEVYDQLTELIEAHRTTLVFVNTRRLAERLAKNLSKRLSDEVVTSHHGSLAKEHRLRAEQRLKSGQLRCLVATASLELGIDIGDVDLVCQMGSPKSIATFLQRVGRSGHGVGRIPKGVLFPASRDDLLECTALLKAIADGKLDEISVCELALDALAQQVVAEVAAKEEIDLKALYHIVTQAYPYRALSEKDFEDVVTMLAEGFSTRRGRQSAYLHYDRLNQKLRPRKGARLIAATNAGTIPDHFDYDVILSPEGHKVGTLNEDFAFESLPGDIFQLGNTSYRILKVEQRQGKLFVADAHGEPPTLPFWFGEAPGRSDELSIAVSDLRDQMDKLLADEANDGQAKAQQWLVEACQISKDAALQLTHYLAAAKAALGHVPSQSKVVVERFFDDTGDMHYVIHSPYGSRLNRAWGLALRKKFCRRFNFELQAAALEDSIILSLSVSHSFPILEPIGYVKSVNAQETLTQAMLDAPLFATHWRWVATTALAVRRTFNGKKSPPYFQRNNAEDLIALLFPDQIACAENIAGQREVPDHPLVTQTINDCLHDVMDINGLVQVLAAIHDKKIEVIGKDLHTPSPLSQEVITAKPYAFLDDAPAEERRVLAIKSKSFLDPQNVSDLSIIDPAAITRITEEILPLHRSRDELHDTLIVFGFLQDQELTENDKDFLKRLTAENRASRIALTDQTLWVASERLHEFQALALPLSEKQKGIIEQLKQTPPEREVAICELIRSRLEGLGPVTVLELANPLGLASREVDLALLALEGEGFAVRGQFDPRVEAEQWCERRILARIHRATVQGLRKAIAPVSSQTLMQFLCDWHHLSEQKSGFDGLAEVANQLEGYAAAAGTWESAILPARIDRYQSHDLDALCHSGEMTWLRILRKNQISQDKRSQLISQSPISLVQRDSVIFWQLEQDNETQEQPALSSAAKQVVEILQTRGACFYSDLLAQTKLLPSQLENTISELVSKAYISSDNFEGLRALITPAKTSTRSRRSRFAPRAGSRFDLAGRWSLVPPPLELSDSEASEFQEEKLLYIAHTLLRRYGVVFRRLLERESHLPPWRDLLRVFWRLEAQGEIRGGRFVSGFAGEQFALPEALEALRKTAKSDASKQAFVLSASDPLNLIGIILPGEKIPANSNQQILIVNGLAIATEYKGVVTALGKDKEPELEAHRDLFLRAKVRKKYRAYSSF